MATVCRNRPTVTPTGSRQTHRNRPPWRSRAADGFAPVPIRRAVPVAFLCAVATVTGSATVPTVCRNRGDGHGFGFAVILFG